MKRQLTKFTTHQLISLLWVSFVSLSFLLPAKSDDQPEANSQTTQIEQLQQAAQECMHTGNYDKAEVSLDKAMELNEPFFAKGRNELIEGRLIGLLSGVYAAEKKWSEAERLYETKGRRIWVPTAVDETVAYFLMQQGKYAEARVVLRPFVANMKPPPEGNFCATPLGEYNRLKEMLATCESKTRDLTEEQLSQLERKRQLEINQLRNGK